MSGMRQQVVKMSAFSALLLALCCSCAGGDDQASGRASTPATSLSPTPTPTPTPTPVAADDSASEYELPSRAEMESWERAIAEATFVQLARETPGLEGVSDETLIAAGDAACDSMDSGDSTRAVLIMTTIALGDVGDIEAVATTVGAASGILCYEHHGYPANH